MRDLRKRPPSHDGAASGLEASYHYPAHMGLQLFRGGADAVWSVRKVSFRTEAHTPLYDMPLHVHSSGRMHGAGGSRPLVVFG